MSWFLAVKPNKIPSISLHVGAIFLLLVFAYTGDIDWTTFTPFQAIDLLYLAKLYNLQYLAQVIKKYLQDYSVKQFNVYDILKYAAKIDESHTTTKLSFTSTHHPCTTTNSPTQQLITPTQGDKTSRALSH